MGVDSQGVIFSGIATPSSGSYDDILVRRYDAAAKKWVLVGGILATTDSRLVGFATDPTIPASPWVRHHPVAATEPHKVHDSVVHLSPPSCLGAPANHVTTIT